MKKALSKWATKQLGSLVKQRASSPLLSSLVSGKNLGTKAVAGAILGTGAEAIFGGDGENQDALLEKLKAEGVVGTGPNQVSEEEFRQHMERGSNMAFSPVESGLESAGIGGVLGGLITPFLGGDKKAGISNNTAEMIRQYQAVRAGRARIKEDTGFEWEDEKTLDELYGKENAFGNAETVDFTSSPLGWLLGHKKDPTYGRGEFRTATDTRYGSDGKPYYQNTGYHKTQKDMDEWLNWNNNILIKAQESGDIKEITKALRQVPEGHRKSRKFFDTLHKTFKGYYKGSDITSESGKKDFKSFVQGILPSAGGTFDPATGRGTPAPVDPSRRTPEELLSNWLSPEGYEWDSEDAYKQSGMAPNDMAGKPSAVPTASTTPTAVAPTAVAPTAPADAVRAQAAQPQQLSAPQQQAADIRAQGGQTAQDNSRQERNFTDTAYNNAYPNQPLGSQAARDAALARMRSNVLQGSGLYEYKTKSGGTNLASTSPDAMTPYSGQTNREVAYQRHFGEENGPWVGDNPLTGKFKDKDGDVWDNYGVYDAIANTPAIEPEPEPEPVPELNTNEPQLSLQSPNDKPVATNPPTNVATNPPTNVATNPPTNGPEKFDFGPLRRARAAFYRNKGVTDTANSLIPNAIDKFDPASAVRNMGQMPMRMATKEFPALSMHGAMTRGGLRRNGMPPVRTIINNNQKPWSAYGLRYPVGQ